ncbi:cyclin-T1-4-like [Panicum miliaceum]|uniref:Cyclin-T1-4-like n=1 Tax=Panicum miliaceum TaxID=4540 RepID=A0A3L6T5J4_PANMI|nr:cyclin-T1-4-like [Panicum miliaceum]
MAMVPSDSSHHGVVDNSPNGKTLGRREEARKLGPSWYFSRKEIEENSPSRRDGIDLKRENGLLCMFLAGKVEETPRPLKDVIVVSYELIHKKDPNAVQRIKQQKEIYDKQKELILLGERVVLVTLGFDLNIHHAYKPLVEAIRKFNVVQKSALPQVAWNFVNDGLRTSLCLQFEPHHIAAGAIFLAAKFLKVKLPAEGDKVWWQDFDVTPRQLEEVSNQMLELYEQNRTPQAQPSQGSEAEGSSAGVRNQHSSVKSEGNSKEPSAKLPNLQHSSLIGAPGHHDVGHLNSDKHISGHKMLQNDNGNHGGSKDRSSKSGSKSDAGMDRSHHDKKSSPGHHYSTSSREFRNPMEEHKPHRSHDNSNETRDGVLGGNEAPGVSSSRMDAMNKIDKDKVKAALEKRRKSKGGVAANVNVMDDDDLLERELEHGVELAVEDEKIKQDKQTLSHDSMPPADLQHVDHVMENGYCGEKSVPTTAEDGEFPRDSKEQHPQSFDKRADGSEHKSQQVDHTLKHHKGHDDAQLAGRHKQDGRHDYKRPKLEGVLNNEV